jgi:putative FmdB family regulatory protein
MPIFEYRCGGCRRKFSLLVGVVAGGSEARCPTCGSEELQKLISRFAVARAEDDLLDDLADPSKMGDMEDPRQMVQWMKRMGKEMGEDLGDDFDELVEEAAREEAEGDPEAGGDSLGEAAPGGPDGLDDE